MNDKDFEQRLYCDPWDKSPEFMAALEEDSARQALTLEARNQDRQLLVNVPEGLKEKLLGIPAQEAQTDKKQPAVRTWTWQKVMPLAACLLLALSLSLYYWPNPTDEISREVFSHIYSELLMLEEDKNIELSTVNEHLASFGGKLKVSPTPEVEVSDMKDCQVARVYSLHLVVKTTTGPVSVLFMSNAPFDEEFPIQDPRFVGIVSPTPRGNLVIVSEKREGITEAKNLMASNLVW